MQRRKLGTAVLWMVCLLGMVAVVWSRPPLVGSRNVTHPSLALAAEEELDPPKQEAAPEQLPAVQEVQVPVELPEALPPNAPALPSLVLVRDVKPYRMTFQFEGNRLFATFTGTLDDGREAECRVAADYHLTKDSMLYGVITSAEFVGSTEDPEDRMEADQVIQQLFDQPFAFRYRLDEGTLTVKDFKIAPIPEPSDFTEVLLPFIVGCYHTAPAPPASL
jgi:hypothetical protein